MAQMTGQGAVDLLAIRDAGDKAVNAHDVNTQVVEMWSAWDTMGMMRQLTQP